jgi:hypothetical protein
MLMAAEPLAGCFFLLGCCAAVLAALTAAFCGFVF